MGIVAERATFVNAGNRIAGDLRLPEGADRAAGLPALVIVTPGSSVKGQIGAVYGGGLAGRGYVTLAFDPSHQGESEGIPRDLENPAVRIEDVRCAVDHLVTLPFVDEARIGVVGICAGGGYAVAAAMIDPRIRAVGAVVPVNIGRAFRQAQARARSIAGTLAAVGEQRTAQARGAAELRFPWIPDTVAEAEAQGVDVDTMDAVRFYRTPRGHDPHATNRLLMTSGALLIGFDAFHLAEELLAQPVQVVVGGRLGLTFSHADGRTLWEKARNREDFVVVEGAGHYELYDTPAYVDQAIGRLAPFFDRHLTGGG